MTVNSTGSQAEQPVHGAPGARSPVVEVTGLSHRFGATRALDGVTFDVEDGEIFGLLGPNGAGKTTTMRVLLTLLPVQAGNARIAGVDVAARRGEVRPLVGWVPQDRAIDPLLTGRENLRFVAGLHHLTRAAARQRADDLLDLVGLRAVGDRLVQELSGGMRRRLELAMGLVHRPRVLFLDEPSVGLDVRARRRVWDHIRHVCAMGTTVVLTTHYLDEADALCDRVAIIHHGRIRAIASPAELKRRHARTRVHLRVEQDPEGIAGAVARSVDPASVVRTGSVVVVESEEVTSVAASVAAYCTERGLSHPELWTERPSLDDVFLAVSGDAGDDLEAAREVGA
jgi:ABC-2 type transport system ATP-binding protein